jgi:hypothetical protein
LCPPGGKRAKLLHTESDVVKRRLLQTIVDTLKSVVFSAFPDMPLERMLSDPTFASEAPAITASGASAASSFHWGMFGSTLGIAHLGDAFESIGDGTQLQRWQSLCARVLRTQLSNHGATGVASKQREPATSDEGTALAHLSSRGPLSKTQEHERAEGESTEATDAGKLLVDGLLMALATLTARAYRLDLVSTAEVSNVLNDLHAFADQQQEGTDAAMTCKGMIGPFSSLFSCGLVGNCLFVSR